MPDSTSHSTLLTQNSPMISSTMNATSATSRSVPHLVASILVFILHNRGHDNVHSISAHCRLPTATQRLQHSARPDKAPHTHAKMVIETTAAAVTANAMATASML